MYQCYGLTGEVGVYAIDGTELTLLQEIGGLPTNNVQGIVSVGQPSTVGGGDGSMANLNLNIEVDSRLYNIFEEVDYTVTLSNDGGTTSNNIIVSAPNPNGTVFTRSSTTAGNYEQFTGEWSISSLAPGETAVLNLTLFTLVENVDITHVVTVIAADELDSDFTNNSDFVTIQPFSNGGVATGIGNVDLELSISTAGTTYTQFENVPYEITLTNNGADAATNVFVNAPIPNGLAFVGSAATNGNYNYFFEQWSLDRLEAGQSATLTLTLYATANNVSLINFVEVFAVDQNDSDSTPGNGNNVSANEDDEAVSVLTPTNSLQGSDTELSLRSSVEVSVSNVDFYPNPTNGLINFNFESNQEYDTEIQIFDVVGRVLQSHGVAANKGVNSIRMDVSSLNTGIYFINLTDVDGNKVNHKFIKID